MKRYAEGGWGLGVSALRDRALRGETPPITIGILRTVPNLRTSRATVAIFRKLKNLTIPIEVGLRSFARAM